MLKTLTCFGLIIGSALLPTTAFSIVLPSPIEKIFSSANATLQKTRSNSPSLQQVGIPRTQYVGELQEKWEFPSDHLPIGMTFDGLNLASWNVLNSEYMSWIEKNTQGLSRSQIVQEHIYIDGSRLTIRDARVILTIKSMLSHPTHPRALISLQECSQAFIEELQRQLSEEHSIILSSDIPRTDQNIVIYNRQALTYDPSESRIDKEIFSLQPGRTVMNLCFAQNQGAKQTIRVINAHLPGEPGNPAPGEFAAYVASLSTPEAVTIAMGDMNFNEVEMGNAFEGATPSEMDFSLIAPYCANIGLDLHSKSIDHFFVFAQGQHAISGNNAEEVLVGLSQTVQLLDPEAFLLYK